MNLDACLKKFHLVNVGACLLLIASKLALFSISGLKDEKLIEKQTYMKNETCKLSSRDF